MVAWLGAARAEAPEVPIRLQVALLARAVEYDRSFPSRVRGRVRVLIVVRGTSADSLRVGEQLRLELEALDTIGGYSHSEQMLEYRSAPELASEIASRSPAVLYLSTDLADEVEAIASSLDGVSILSVGVNASYVARRAVLGFDAESGRPQLLIHLAQARRQLVAFRPEFLRLVRVIR